MFYEVPQRLRCVTPKAQFNQPSNNCPEMSLGLQVEGRPLGIVKLLKLLQETKIPIRIVGRSLSQIKPSSLSLIKSTCLTKKRSLSTWTAWKKKLAIYTKDRNLNARPPKQTCLHHPLCVPRLQGEAFLFRDVLAPLLVSHTNKNFL
jgi:hypothetical protein